MGTLLLLHPASHLPSLGVCIYGDLINPTLTLARLYFLSCGQHTTSATVIIH